MKKVMKDIFLKLMFNTLKNYTNFIVTYHFYMKEKKNKKVEKLVTILNHSLPRAADSSFLVFARMPMSRSERLL